MENQDLTVEELLRQWSEDAQNSFPIFDPAFLSSEPDLLGNDWTEFTPFLEGQENTSLENNHIPDLSSLPSLSTSPSTDVSQLVHSLNGTVEALSKKVAILEDELLTKTKKLEKISEYIGNLQPFLNSIGDTVQDLKSRFLL
ncbi:hypothetical protein TMEN_6617 [Trichophyton mentagrophytes]|nr:hypothetical protein TMEN_6617 [Trichophyton mentagrophytes]